MGCIKKNRKRKTNRWRITYVLAIFKVRGLHNREKTFFIGN